jgi:hypothetical protein
MTTKRIGECKRGGRCCTDCIYLGWITERDIKAGESIYRTGIGYGLVAECTKPDGKFQGCTSYPSTPEQRQYRPDCGFDFIEE